jgi:hypothetical protein
VTKESKGFRLVLGGELEKKLGYFCVAHYGAPQTNIIRLALEAFIEQRLKAEPQVRKRFEDARRKRLR